MTDDRKGGIALIAGTAGTIVTMSFHPTGRDLLAPGQFESMAARSTQVHALAIACLPVLFLGAMALVRRLSAPDRLAVTGLVVYGFSLVAVLTAATLSGFVSPGAAREMLAPAAPSPEVWRALFNYSGRLNQAFAWIFSTLSSAAIVLWSAAILRGRRLPLGLGIYGVIAGTLLFLLVGSGHLPLHVHGFGLVVLAQAIWFIGCGVAMLRSDAPQPPAV